MGRVGRRTDERGLGLGLGFASCLDYSMATNTEVDAIIRLVPLVKHCSVVHLVSPAGPPALALSAPETIRSDSPSKNNRQSENCPKVFPHRRHGLENAGRIISCNSCANHTNTPTPSLPSWVSCCTYGSLFRQRELLSSDC